MAVAAPRDCLGSNRADAVKAGTRDMHRAVILWNRLLNWLDNRSGDTFCVVAAFYQLSACCRWR